jgi:TonB family protein
MYFDFEDNRPDTPHIPRPMSSREVVLITVNLHLLFLVAILLGPKIPFVQRIIEARQAEAELQRQQQQQALQQERPRFVTVEPLRERPAPPRERADLSDLDRRARTPRAPDPRNPLPYSRGNSIERAEAQPESAPAPGNAAGDPAPTQPQPQPPPVQLPQSDTGLSRPTENTRPRGSLGVLADAIRNVERYAQTEQFHNPQGGKDQEFDSGISFDTKGVDFGWWLARFKARLRRNWLPLIPQAVMTMHGRVVVTFYVHKDGRITEVTVLRPSPIDGFTVAARGAVQLSNPVDRLPEEYPDDKAFFTVTFFYNEYPGQP